MLSSINHRIVSNDLRTLSAMIGMLDFANMDRFSGVGLRLK